MRATRAERAAAALAAVALAMAARLTGLIEAIEVECDVAEMAAEALVGCTCRA